MSWSHAGIGDFPGAQWIWYEPVKTIPTQIVEPVGTPWTDIPWVPIQPSTIGWMCPRCGACWAPDIKRCYCNSGLTTNGTLGVTNGGADPNGEISKSV